MALPSGRASLVRSKSLHRISHAVPSITSTSRSFPSHSCSASSSTASSSSTIAAASTTPEAFKVHESQADKIPKTPRWKETPRGMKAPIPMDFAKNPVNKIWVVNNDPVVLDNMYDKLLGPGGSKVLPEEIKWLAVTHKSFDQGRRGFNDRLALMGRMVLYHEVVKDTVGRSPMEGTQWTDQWERTPFQHEQLASVDNLLVRTPKSVISMPKLHALATSVGLVDVMRWKPRQVNELELSGITMVASGAIYAIIGAIYLQHGAAFAQKMVLERILAQLPK